MSRSGRGSRFAAVTCVILLMVAGRDTCNASVAPARRVDPAQPPVCALVVVGASGLADAPLVPLVEAELGRMAAAGELVLVERAEVERVLAEQQLAALFGAEGVGPRIRLGGLLRADVLVLLRARGAAAPDPAVPAGQGGDAAAGAGAGAGAAGRVSEIVVCETATGLRLETDALPAADGADPGPAAAAAGRVVARGLAERAEPAREVCAVPPFVSQDLAGDFAHLKAAYAKLVEQDLLDRPGIRVVELDEARALARELALGGQRRIERASLPLYLLGEFRNDGTGARRSVTVALRVARGEETLGARTKKGIRPADAPAFVRTAAAELLAAANKSVAPARADRVDGREEARQLAQRADVFQRLGDDDEAVALLEAAVLLDPDDSAVRMRAMSLLGRMTRTRWPGWPYEPAERVRTAGSFYLRALEHAEAALRDPKVQWHESIEDPFFRLVLITPGHWWHTGDGKPVPSVVRELRAREAAALRRIAEARVVADRPDALLFMTAASRAMPPEEQPTWVLDMLRRHVDRPNARHRAFEWPRLIGDERLMETDEGRRLLDGAAALPNPEMEIGVADLRAWLATELPDRKRRKAAAQARLRPIEPAAGTADDAETVSAVGVRFEAMKDLKNLRCLPLGDGVDLMWGGAEAHLMTAPGEMRPVDKLTRRWPGITPALYDGRYVWCTLSAHVNDDPPVLVCDPRTGEVWEVTTGHGLPPLRLAEARATYNVDPSLAIAAVEPGRACVAGFFGRTWVADVRFDPKRGPRVRVLHEARERADRQRATDWRSTAMAFDPAYMFTLTSPGDGGGGGGAAASAQAQGPAPARRIILGRRVNIDRNMDLSLPVALHPLVIDPDAGTVAALEDEVRYGAADEMVADGGALYWAERPEFRRGLPEVITYSLWRIRLPDLRKERVAERAFEGSAVTLGMTLAGDRLVVSGEQLWATDLTTGASTPLGGGLPYALPFGERPLLMPSNHYGLLLRNQAGDTWRVRLGARPGS